MQGDSGGPLIFEGKQVGIISLGYRICNEPLTLFVNLAYYEDWIETNKKGEFLVAYIFAVYPFMFVVLALSILANISNMLNV